MAAPTLHNYKLPRNLSARTSLDIAHALTGHRKETEMVKLLAMAVHYASWTLAEATLSEYRVHLSGIEAEEDQQLLDFLASPATFAIRGDHDSLPAGIVRQAQASARQWRTKLSASGTNLQRLRSRAVALLDEHLCASDEVQRMLVAELQVLVMCRTEASSDSDTRERMGNITVRRAAGPGAEAPLGNPRRVTRTFGNPAEALAFILQMGGFGLQNISFAPGVPAAGAAEGPRAAAAAAEAPSAAERKAAVELAKLPKARVYDCAEAFAILQKMPPQSPHEGNNQQRRLLETMSADQGWRLMSQQPEGQPLAELYTHFPHFRPVLDNVARNLALAACGTAGRPVRIAPMLLRGAPGSGKTFFAQELARVLGTHFVERDLAVLSEAFVISGMDSTWKGSKPGIVFDALVNGRSANPVICLNEVDKAKVTGTHNSPLASLYALLEPTSSQRFFDEFVPVPLDASNIIWVLTANDGPIPDPILTRLDVFDVPQPNQEQCRAIAVSVWENICIRTLPSGHDFDPQLPADVLTAVSAMSPRHMRRALTGAVGAAALAGRKFLQRADLDVALHKGAPQSRPIGFLT